VGTVDNPTPTNLGANIASPVPSIGNFLRIAPKFLSTFSSVPNFNIPVDKPISSNPELNPGKILLQQTESFFFSI
jgi:hypothetical protein